MHSKCEDRDERIELFSGPVGWLHKFIGWGQLSPLKVDGNMSWKTGSPGDGRGGEGMNACNVGERSPKELEWYWSALWPGFTQLWTYRLGRKTWFWGNKTALMWLWMRKWSTLMELRSPGFRVFMISYPVTTARFKVLKVSFLEPMVVWDPDGSDSVSTLSWGGWDVCWRGFRKRFLKSLPHQKESGSRVKCAEKGCNPTTFRTCAGCMFYVPHPLFT